MITTKLLVIINISQALRSKLAISGYSLLFHMWSLTRAHSRRRPALVATTFLHSRGGRLRELRLYLNIIKVLFHWYFCPVKIVIESKLRTFSFTQNGFKKRQGGDMN